MSDPIKSLLAACISDANYVRTNLIAGSKRDRALVNLVGKLDRVMELLRQEKKANA